MQIAYLKILPSRALNLTGIINEEHTCQDFEDHSPVGPESEMSYLSWNPCEDWRSVSDKLCISLFTRCVLQMRGSINFHGYFALVYR